MKRLNKYQPSMRGGWNLSPPLQSKRVAASSLSLSRVSHPFPGIYSELGRRKALSDSQFKSSLSLWILRPQLPGRERLTDRAREREREAELVSEWPTPLKVQPGVRWRIFRGFRRTEVNLFSITYSGTSSRSRPSIALQSCPSVAAPTESSGTWADIHILLASCCFDYNFTNLAWFLRILKLGVEFGDERDGRDEENSERVW